MDDDRPSSPPSVSQGNGQDGPLSVNLQIISPSAGVGNLRFPSLPATTTVQQLKAKIRESVASRPADEHQRLIHRGRMLARDTDTLLDIFGEEAVCGVFVLRSSMPASQITDGTSLCRSGPASSRQYIL
jgi:hypothetical protein